MSYEFPQSVCHPRTFLKLAFIVAASREESAAYYSIAPCNGQFVGSEGVENDFGSLPRAGHAPDSVQFCMAVLHHIVDHSITLKTCEVWRAAFFHTFKLSQCEGD